MRIENQTKLTAEIVASNFGGNGTGWRMWKINNENRYIRVSYNNRICVNINYARYHDGGINLNGNCRSRVAEQLGVDTDYRLDSLGEDAGIDDVDTREFDCSQCGERYHWTDQVFRMRGCCIECYKKIERKKHDDDWRKN